VDGKNAKESENAMKLKSSTLLLTIGILAVVATVGGAIAIRDKKKPVGTQIGQAHNTRTLEGVTIAATSKDLALPRDELVRLRTTAAVGDCEAALKLARHYSFAENKLDESVKWLRIAAKCDDVSAKGMLISMLLATEDDASSTNEISKLLLEIRRLDVAQAKKYEEIVVTQRRK
jgi:hypothetical protein